MPVYNGNKAYPVRPDRFEYEDIGPFTRGWPPATNTWGWGATPHNLSARGLDVRKDIKKKRFP